MGWKFEPVAVVHSCFAEKFAIPRQPLLAPAATATLELLPPYDQPEALEGLEGVSHLWLLFVFHAAGHGSKHLRVRPPRLGGNQRIGVFASRAPHRPNPIGQSVVRLEGIVDGRLLLSGVDLLDGTPVLDIKPYVPYADAIGDAHNSLAPAPPAPIKRTSSSSTPGRPVLRLSLNKRINSFSLRGVFSQTLNLISSAISGWKPKFKPR